MDISVTYDDTDVAKALESIINHPNQEEFVKLLTPLLCSSFRGSTYFFKLLLGVKLPAQIPNGRLCKIHIDNVGYGLNKKELLLSDLVDEDGNLIVKIKEFRGHHDYASYNIEYTDIMSDGTRKVCTSAVNQDNLMLIEEI